MIATRPDPEIPAKLLAWYDAHARALPWRALPGEPAPDPYRVWLSEIMLQQTTVAAVKPYFAAFTQRWPDVAALANAPEEDVMAAWAGLGYYSRARNLAKAARVVAEMGGHLLDQHPGADRLGVDQNPVAVEDHQIDPPHRAPSVPHRGRS